MSQGTSLAIALYTLGLPISGDDPASIALGGSETAAVSMARALRRQGHQVTVFCVIDQPRTVAGVDFLPAATVRSHLAAHDCDVFLSCRYHDVLRQGVPARLIGMWHHDLPSHDLLSWVGDGLAKSDFSLFVSQFQLAAYETCFPGIGRHSILTSNGVDFEAVEEVMRHPGPDTSAPRFIFGSRPERGLHFLLNRIWPRLRERLPTAELVLSSYAAACFDPALQPYYDACEALLRGSRGITSCGALTRREFWSTLIGCRALIYPGDSAETSCMVALEAQALGVPVVTSARFALTETVAFQDTLVAEPWGTDAYVDSFVAKVCRLLADETFDRAAREAGRRHVIRESHSWDAIAARWSEHFEQLFAHRFATRKAGILRSLLHTGSLEDATNLAASEPPHLLDPADLADLQALTPIRRVDDQARLGAELTRTRPRPKISATLLVKNEEAHLRRCLESISDIADEIIIGDTGSTDRTLSIAEEMGFVRTCGCDPDVARLRRRIVAVTFNDFAQARNDLARHATGDYILWQDADEVLIHPDRVRPWIDDNVYYEGFCWEQRHALVDGQIAPDRPIRCFRRETEAGSLRWFGCIHEVVEYELNRGPTRILPITEVYLAHVGYLFEALRIDKSIVRNLPLLVRDRIENPDRSLGYVLGLREYMSLANLEIEQAGGAMTRKAYRYLEYGFEVWDQHIRQLSEPYRRVAYGYYQEILSKLAHFRLPLRKTGCIPFRADVSISTGHVGGQGVNGNISALFSSLDELKEAAETNLRAAGEWITGQTLPPPAAIEIESTPRWLQVDLPPALFGLEP